MLVKFCGFTRALDVEAACALPIWSVGYVFYANSKRFIPPREAANCSQIAHRAGIQCVGVFAGRGEAEVRAICELANIDYIQIYEHDLIPALRSFRPIIAAHRISTGEELAAIAPPPPGELLLLDRREEGSFGGTGKSFDWNHLKNFRLLDKTIVAGGINEHNIATLLAEHHPYGIDLSSGIEDSPGVKSIEKMKTIMKIVRW